MSPESLRAQMQPQSPKPEAEKPGEKSQAELRTELESKLRAMKAPYEAAMEEYKAALKDGTFEDQDGEEEGAGERRKLAFQTKIRTQVERAQGLRRQLDSGEELPQPSSEEEFDTAKALEENREFLKQLFESWYGSDAAKAIEKVAAVDPRSHDYAALAEDVKLAEFGAYTLNPEMHGVDFESARVFVPDLSTFAGRSVPEVVKHVVDVYGETYHVPGIEYWKWLIENPIKNPPGVAIKNADLHLFLGSAFRDLDGDWSVPAASWEGSKWDKRPIWFAGIWSAKNRVVLLEK